MLATPAASRRHKDLLIAGHGAKTRFPIVLCALVRDCRTMTAVSTRAMIPIFPDLVVFARGCCAGIAYADGLRWACCARRAITENRR